MADATLYTAKGTNNPEYRPEPGHEKYIINAYLDGAAYVSDLVTGKAETYPDVDQLADNETGYISGILLGPVKRPSDTWTADTALADNTWVRIHQLGSNCGCYLLVNGQDTPVAGVKGQTVFGTSTDGSSNDSRDGSATLNNTQGFDNVVGKLDEDFTTGDSTSAANGTYAKVRI